MTLRHIVTWKLSGETVAERDAQAAEMITALEALNGVVPTIETLRVHRNELFDGDNWDVTLVGDFADADALAAYAVHPAHVAAGAIVKKHAIGRVATDFTV